MTLETKAPIVGVVFSKNRAMQLDATLHSFFLRCQDPQLVQLKVLFLTTDKQHREQYMTLQRDYPEVTFTEETDFRKQTLSCLTNHNYVLFLVDDNLFVRDFSLQTMLDALVKYPKALGFSLRLGCNVEYAYTLKRPQKAPPFQELEIGALLYDWALATGDFKYALEISSSLYRIDDLNIFLQGISFNNPNTLERKLSLLLLLGIFNHKKSLLCPKHTIAFCAPINRVQSVVANESGRTFPCSIEKLCEKFQQGYRINVQKYLNYLPKACHEEVELHFVRGD